MSSWRDRGWQSVIVRLVDFAVQRQGPAARERVAKEREKNAGASPQDVINSLTRTYRLTTVGTGAGVGATAAAPGIGTITSVALAGGEAFLFLHATVRYVLGLAQVHGMDPGDAKRRRALVLGVLTGEEVVDDGTDQPWAAKLREATPGAGTSSLQRMLGSGFIARYAVRKSAVVFGRAFPFGLGAVIGGVANYSASDRVVDNARDAFGGAPPSWDAAARERYQGAGARA